MLLLLFIFYNCLGVNPGLPVYQANVCSECHLHPSVAILFSFLLLESQSSALTA